jgi:hypothetical protein
LGRAERAWDWRGVSGCGIGRPISGHTGHSGPTLVEVEGWAGWAEGVGRPGRAFALSPETPPAPGETVRDGTPLGAPPPRPPAPQPVPARCGARGRHPPGSDGAKGGTRCVIRGNAFFPRARLAPAHRPWKGGRPGGSEGVDGSGVSGYNIRPLDAGWSSLVARRAHNPKVAGSNPAPAIAGFPPPKPGGFLLRGRESHAREAVGRDGSRASAGFSSRVARARGGAGQGQVAQFFARRACSGRHLVGLQEAPVAR